MPDPDFTVRVDRDEMAERDLAAALSGGAVPPGRPGQVDAHHGARDDRQAARARSGRDHARSGGAGKSRSYAFRRS